MVTNRILTDIITQTFKQEVGKYQAGKGNKAMQVSLKLAVDSSKEDGYRHLDILIYAAQNYVGVYFRQRWDIIALEDLEFDSEGDGCPKAGKDYVKEVTAWERVAFHDSGWTEGIGRIINSFADRIVSLGGKSGKHWFEVVEAPKEIQ